MMPRVRGYVEPSEWPWGKNSLQRRKREGSLRKISIERRKKGDARRLTWRWRWSRAVFA